MTVDYDTEEIINRPRRGRFHSRGKSGFYLAPDGTAGTGPVYGEKRGVSGSGNQTGQPGKARCFEIGLDISQKSGKIRAGESDFKPQQGVGIAAKDGDAVQFIHIITGAIDSCVDGEGALIPGCFQRFDDGSVAAAAGIG